MKPILWLLLAARANPEVPAVVPTLAWLAEDAGAEFEMYLEDERDGRLFARSGSTVLGGHHHQQFNYLHAVCEVRYLILGEVHLFRSSMALCGGQILAAGDTALALYQALGVDSRTERIPVPVLPPAPGRPDLRPYYYPEVYFRRAVGMPEQTAFPDDSFRAFTVRLADRWRQQAQGVAFGDPDAILAMLATLCRERRVAVFEKVQIIPPQDIVANAYAEQASPASADVRRLALAIGNRLIVGRQTGDGDLFDWSRDGIAIKIMDPNRPAFPVVERLPHPWHNRTATVFDQEPDDRQLAAWADEGKCLAALLVHSGEMAHNEAMLNLLELCTVTGLRLGIGVHVCRYATCPQLWELISTPRDRGGALGLVEPVLHCGGQGVLTENTCPPELLAEHCRAALRQIAEIAGDAWRPRGHLTFMDSDMAAFTSCPPSIYEAIAAAGLEYTVSCAWPGRNRIIRDTPGHIVLNQSTRGICTGSPYVRISTVADIAEKTPATCPGWWLGVIDAPVVAFNSYVWEQGTEFMKIVRHLTKHPSLVNVTPRVVARYATLLRRRGLVPGLPPA